MRLQYVSGCGESTIKVQRKYAESKAYVQLKYVKSTIKYGKSTVLYGNFFNAYCKSNLYILQIFYYECPTIVECVIQIPVVL